MEVNGRRATLVFSVYQGGTHHSSSASSASPPSPTMPVFGSRSGWLRRWGMSPGSLGLRYKLKCAVAKLVSMRVWPSAMSRVTPPCFLGFASSIHPINTWVRLSPHVRLLLGSLWVSFTHIFLGESLIVGVGFWVGLFPRIGPCSTTTWGG